MLINIRGIPKPELLAALVSAVPPRTPFTLEEATQAIEEKRLENGALRPLWFDIIGGREVYVNITGDHADDEMFDRFAQKPRAMNAVVGELRKRFPFPAEEEPG